MSMLTLLVALAIGLRGLADADDGGAATVSATILEIAPNVRVYRSKVGMTLFVPVSDQSVFDDAATGFAGERASIRTFIAVELENMGADPLFVSYDIAGGPEGQQYVDPKTGAPWRIWPLLLGEPADPEPAIFLAPGHKVQRTFALAARLEPLDVGAGDATKLPKTLEYSFVHSTAGFPAGAAPGDPVAFDVKVQWRGHAAVSLSRVGY